MWAAIGGWWFQPSAQTRKISIKAVHSIPVLSVSNIAGKYGAKQATLGTWMCGNLKVALNSPMELLELKYMNQKEEEVSEAQYPLGLTHVTINGSTPLN